MPQKPRFKIDTAKALAVKEATNCFNPFLLGLFEFCSVLFVVFNLTACLRHQREVSSLGCNHDDITRQVTSRKKRRKRKAAEQYTSEPSRATKQIVQSEE